jgi:hypothetical protein
MMRVWVTSLFGLLVAVAATASPREEAADCVARLTAIQAELADIERAARQTNDVTRADCIKKHLTSLTGLIEVSRQAQSWLEASVEMEDPEAVAAERDKLEAVCQRGEKLRQLAVSCVSIVAPRPRRTTPPRLAKVERPAPVSRSTWQQPRRATTRNPEACLRQSDLACLLAQALNMSGAADCIQALRERNVEPLGGWDGQQCATVDVFCVALGRALELEVENPADPSQYWQALAEFGLPVDQVLPPRPETGSSVILLDREAREFLSRGLGAPVR